METNNEKPKKRISVSKRKRVSGGERTVKRRSKALEAENTDNPMLSQPPISSTAMLMINRNKITNEIESEVSINRRKIHGISEDPKHHIDSRYTKINKFSKILRR